MNNTARCSIGMCLIILLSVKIYFEFTMLFCARSLTHSHLSERNSLCYSNLVDCTCNFTFKCSSCVCFNWSRCWKCSWSFSHKLLLENEFFILVLYYRTRYFTHFRYSHVKRWVDVARPIVGVPKIRKLSLTRTWALVLQHAPIDLHWPRCY